MYTNINEEIINKVLSEMENIDKEYVFYMIGSKEQITNTLNKIDEEICQILKLK